MKKRAEVELNAKTVEAYDRIANDPTQGIELMSRYQLLRLQSSRSAVLNTGKQNIYKVKDKNDSPANGSSSTSNAGLFTPPSDEKSTEARIRMILQQARDASEAANEMEETSPKPDTRVRLDLEFSTEFGYQTKAIRLFVVHELVYQFVYGHEESRRPNCYDLFPPGDSFYLWPVRTEKNLTVFVDEESPLRFHPPLPVYTDALRGWFMVQDFLFALPLSAFVLIVHVNKKVNKDILQAYLNDPIRRHICIGCLPNDVRIPLLKDKKVVRQLEHIMLTLCALGLMAIAPNPDMKRFASPRASVFYVSKSGTLYDTSTSGRGMRR